MTLNAFAKSLENAERIVRNVGCWGDGIEVLEQIAFLVADLSAVGREAESQVVGKAPTYAGGRRRAAVFELFQEQRSRTSFHGRLSRNDALVVHVGERSP